MPPSAQRYEHVARALNEAGFVVYARDQRGHGASADPRALGDLGQGSWPGLALLTRADQLAGPRGG
jgi:alpha-beta hydrolase superfamily lysophospholipase